MTTLSDQDIVSSLQKGTMRIDPFRERNLTPNGYDLTAHEVYYRSPESKVTIGQAYLDPGEWCLVSTEERLEIPPDVCANLWLRTTYIRKGLVAGFGMVDAGFKGNLTVSIANMGPEKVSVPIGDRLFQIVFTRLSTMPNKLYAGTYQNQSGVTLEGGRKT